MGGSPPSPFSSCTTLSWIRPQNFFGGAHHRVPSRILLSRLPRSDLFVFPERASSSPLMDEKLPVTARSEKASITGTQDSILILPPSDETRTTFLFWPVSSLLVETVLYVLRGNGRPPPFPTKLSFPPCSFSNPSLPTLCDVAGLWKVRRRAFPHVATETSV